jgi:hypothetical protein
MIPTRDARRETAAAPQAGHLQVIKIAHLTLSTTDPKATP